MEIVKFDGNARTVSTDQQLNIALRPVPNWGNMWVPHELTSCGQHQTINLASDSLETPRVWL